MDNVVSLDELFHKRVFRVPDYQRGYSWEEQQVQEFLGRVAPGDCSPEALTRSGQGDFHHPAPPLMCLVATPPISARQPAGGGAGSVPTIG